MFTILGCAVQSIEHSKTVPFTFFPLRVSPGCDHSDNLPHRSVLISQGYFMYLLTPCVYLFKYSLQMRHMAIAGQLGLSCSPDPAANIIS